MKIYAMLLAAAILPMGMAGCKLAGGSGIGGIGDVDVMKLGEAGKHLANAQGLSAVDEDAIGQSAGISLTNTFTLCQDKALTKYVNFVGLSVSVASDDPSAAYVFAVLETKEINAWSSPGGYVFIARGVLNNCRDEAELAGVLAHEMAHICHHDGLEEVKQAEARAGFTEASESYSKTAAFSGVIDKGADIFTKQAHSQPSELKADAAAVHYMSGAGYNPNSYLHFLERLQKMGASGGVMSTHPGTGQRVSVVAQEITKVRPGGAILAERFAANVKQQP